MQIKPIFNTTAIVLAAVAFLVTSCKEGSKEIKPEPDSPTVFKTLPPRPVAKPMLPKAPRREILVGGCLVECEHPKEALQAFLNKTLKPSTVEAVKPFIDSSLLLHNGKNYGARWASLFGDGKIGERNTEIEKWLSSWLSWTQRLVDPADKEKKEHQVRIIEENQKRFVIDYEHPQLVERSDGRPIRLKWRITLRPRGLEWLVVAVVDLGVEN